MSPAAAAIPAVLARQHYLHRAQLRQGATQLGACRVIHPGAEEEAAGGGVGGAEADEHIANAPAASLRPAQLAQRDCDSLRTELEQLRAAASAAAARAGAEAQRTGSDLQHLSAQAEALRSALAASEATSASLRAALEESRAGGAALGESLVAARVRCAAAEAFAAAADEKLLRGELVRAQLHETIQELRGNIRVVCRVRPLSSAESAVESVSAASTATIRFSTERELRNRGLELCVAPPPLPAGAQAPGRSERERLAQGSRYTFAFDRVFDSNARQADVFDEVEPLVRSALDGRRVCVFAYGATGSGKTHTMLGGGGGGDEQGVVPRTLEMLFSARAREEAAGGDAAVLGYGFSASILEVYCEELFDLLGGASAGGGHGPALEVRLDGNGNAYAAGATWVDVKDGAQVQRLLARASAARATGRTGCNERSSRSHMVLSLRITGRRRGEAFDSNGPGSNGSEFEGALHLVDLAGSERLSRSGAEGQALTETQAINKSLSSLGDVIAALAAKAPHIPYRNSKLTHLLAPSLGGDAKTLMLVNCAPSREAAPETLCSLRFAAKAASVELAVQQRKGEIGGPLASRLKR